MNPHDRAVGAGAIRPIVVVVATGAKARAFLRLIVWLMTGSAGAAVSAAPDWARVQLDQPQRLEVHAMPLVARNSGYDASPFTVAQGTHVGIDAVNILSPDDLFPPFYDGRGVAAGDVDQDGYADSLVATKQGLRLYINQGGEVFQARDIGVPGLESYDVFVVALVDIDNDGWLDIYFTSYRDGNHYLLNRHGEFSSANLHSANLSPVVITNALSFGDVDRDGTANSSDVCRESPVSYCPKWRTERRQGIANRRYVTGRNHCSDSGLSEGRCGGPAWSAAVTRMVTIFMQPPDGTDKSAVAA